MNIDFDRVLDSLNGMILDFDLNSFTNKNIVPLKADHVLVSDFSAKVFGQWDFGNNFEKMRFTAANVCRIRHFFVVRSRSNS